MSDYYDRDKFTGGRQNPPPPQKKPDNNTGWYTWPLIIVLFSLGIWPLALILLFYNIRNESKGKTVTVRGGAHSGGAESAVERAMWRAEDRINEASKAAVDMANRVVGSSGGRVGRVGVRWTVPRRRRQRSGNGWQHRRRGSPRPSRCEAGTRTQDRSRNLNQSHSQRRSRNLSRSMPTAASGQRSRQRRKSRNCLGRGSGYWASAFWYLARCWGWIF